MLTDRGQEFVEEWLIEDGDRPENHETRIERLENKVDQLEQEVQDARDEAEDVQKELAEFKQDMNGEYWQAVLDEIDTRIDERIDN